MSALLIWMNTHEAKLFHVESNSINVEKILGQDSDSSDGTNSPSDESYFFRKIAEKLKVISSETWLLMGPGNLPLTFQTFLQTYYQDLFAKVIGVEKVSPMPDSEILSIGRTRLQKHYLFNSA